MVSEGSSTVIPRKQLFWILGLVALSTLLFVVGVVAERQSEQLESTGAHSETTLEASVPQSQEGEGAEGGAHVETEPHNESSENGVRNESTEGEAASSVAEAPNPEAVLGINLESPWLVAGAVVIWVILAAALIRFGYSALPVVIVVALLMLVFDALEVIRNLFVQPHWGIAAIALIVLLTRAGIAIFSTQTLRTRHRMA
jgi:hypothetical protein